MLKDKKSVKDIFLISYQNTTVLWLCVISCDKKLCVGIQFPADFEIKTYVKIKG